MPDTLDYAHARHCMVEGQIRPNKVTDPRILQAMRALPRERFLPPMLAARAYADDCVPLPNGREMMEPMVIARLIQLLRLRPGESLLVVGAGAGYGAALGEACGAAVTALEEDADLLAAARAILPALGSRVLVAEGPLAQGWPAGGPYDAILIEGAVPSVPDLLAGQLKPLGRLATVIAAENGPGQAVLAEPVRLGEQVRLRPQPFFDAAARMLPAFAPPPAFIF